MEDRLPVLPQRSSPFRDDLDDYDVDAHVQELRLNGNLEDISASFVWNVFQDFIDDEERATLLWLSDGVFVAQFDHSESLDLIPVARRFGFACWMSICGVCVFVRRGLNPVPVCSALVDWRCNAEASYHVLIRNDMMADTDDEGAIALPVTTEALVRLLGSRNVNRVSFVLFKFNEGQSRALATAATLGVLSFDSCVIPNQFWEALQLNQSPRALFIESYFRLSVFDKFLFAATLRVNTSIESLCYHLVEGSDDEDEVMESFAHNRGIVELHLVGSADDDTWSRLSRALARNRTVTSLDLDDLLSSAGFRSMSRESRTMRTRAIGYILEHNTLIQQVMLSEWVREWVRDEGLYQSLVVPRLELNQFRPHVRSVQEAPNAERGDTFLNAYSRAGDNLSMVYLLLRENTDFVVEMVNP